MTAIATIAAGLLGGAPAWADDARACHRQNLYFPLIEGASWTYRTTMFEPGAGSHVSSSKFAYIPADNNADGAIGGEFRGEMQAGPTVISMAAPIQLIGGAVYFGDWFIQYSDGATAESKGGLQQFLPSMKDIAVGATWRMNGGLTAQAGGATLATGTYDIGANATASGVAYVATPAGEYGALEVRQQSHGVATAPILGTVPSTWETVFWFAPGIGMIKGVGETPPSRSETVLVSHTVPPCCGFVVMQSVGGVTAAGAEVSPGAALGGAGAVTVPDGGELELGGADGSRIKVRGETTLRLETICAENKNLLDLLRGKILGEIGKAFGGSIEVNTPTGWVGVRGTVFSVEVLARDAGPLTIVDVEEGEVAVRPHGGVEYALGPGDHAEF